MSALSNYLENALINLVFRGTALTPPANRYVALFTTNPGEGGTGTEVTGGGYARQASSYVAPSDGATSNTADINFPVASADWGTISHFAIYDAATAGNMLVYGAFAVAKPIFSGDQFIIRSGDLDITFA